MTYPQERKKGGYEKEGKRKERRKKKEAEIEPIHSYFQKGDVAKTTQLHHTRTRERAKRREQDLPYVFHTLYSREGKLPPPHPQPNSQKLPPLSLTLKILLLLPPLLCSLYLSTGSVLPPPSPPHPPSPFPFRCHVCIHTIMISLFQPSVLSCLWTLETFRF